MSLSNYPPGHPTGFSYEELPFECVNEDCPEFGTTWEAELIIDRETNSGTLRDEDEGDLCPTCKEEGKAR